jgi:hypothetical protein
MIPIDAATPHFIPRRGQNTKALLLRTAACIWGHWPGYRVDENAIIKIMMNEQEAADIAVEVTQRYFTVDEYYRMAEAAIFTEDDRVELIDGASIEKSPLESPHVTCVIRLDGLLWRSSPQDTLVSIQNPVRLNDFSEPQPDVMLLRYRADSYARHHATPGNVLLQIEVPDTILAYDQKVKLPLYARAAIVETWIIVDIAHSRIRT